MAGAHTDSNNFIVGFSIIFIHERFHIIPHLMTLIVAITLGDGNSVVVHFMPTYMSPVLADYPIVD